MGEATEEFIKKVSKRKIKVFGNSEKMIEGFKSKIPRRKRKSFYTNSYSKIRVKEDLIADKLQKLTLDNVINVVPVKIEKEEEWIERKDPELSFSNTLQENRTRNRNRTRANRNQNDKENLEFLRAESRTGLEKLLTLSNSRIPRPTATATIRNRPEECMALQIWKPNPVTSTVCPSPSSLRMPARSSSMGNLRENQLDEYEGYYSYASDSDFGGMDTD